MPRPAVRRRLQSELAALPQQLVSYEELLALFTEYGGYTAIELRIGGGTAASADIRTAIRLAAELLPQLVPDNPRFRYTAAVMESHVPAKTVHTPYLSMLLSALEWPGSRAATNIQQ